MFRHIEVDEAASMVGQDDDDKEPLHVTVVMTKKKKSRETRAFTWLLRKVFHVGEGSWRCRTRYFSTVDLVTSMPSLCSSPTIRGEPQVGLAGHMSWMSVRISLALEGRPGVPCTLTRRQ